MKALDQLNDLINRLGGRESLADYLGISTGNVKNLISPKRVDKKGLPTWAKSMLYVQERWPDKNGEEPKKTDAGDEPT